jgi:hypothetical protein
VETRLAKKIMAGEVPDGSGVRVGIDEQGLVFDVLLPEKEIEGGPQ